MLLQLIWFILIVTLFIIYFILDGFDLGAGVITLFVAKNKAEQEELLAPIQRVWDGNQVWLVAAIGAMFAAFPKWYGTLLSGFYLPFFIIIFGLILRGLGLLYREINISSGLSRFSLYAITFSSFLILFCFGMIFSSLFVGIEFLSNNLISSNFKNYLNLVSLLGGGLMVALCSSHAINYFLLRNFNHKIKSLTLWSTGVNLLTVILSVAWIGSILLFSDFKRLNVVYFCILSFSLVILLFVSLFKTFQYKFILSSVELALFIAIPLTSRFPYIFGGNPTNNLLTVFKASSGEHTLKLMLVVTIILLPIIFCYQFYQYKIYWKLDR